MLLIYLDQIKTIDYLLLDFIQSIYYLVLND